VGKKRIKIVSAQEKGKEKRKIVKTGKEHGRITDMGQVALEEAQRIAEKEEKLKKEAKVLATEAAQKQVQAKKKVKKRSQRYRAARKKIKPDKLYSLDEAVKLVKKTTLSRFNGSLELHLVVKEAGLSGQISFPHPTGKEQKIVIADDKIIEKIKKGKIDFDLLIAAPEMMKKLAPLAKILGPKGLMPNPKAGTISENPQEVVKKLQGKTQYRTEKKAPLIHLVVGKIDQPDKNLGQNIQAVLNTIGLTNIKKAVLCATMGPGVKIDLDSV
jgi:large subunit ribosomal protein L1